MKPNRQITGAPRVPTHDEIERLAYAIWQHKGSPIGLSLECWLEAERALTRRIQAAHRSSGASRRRTGRADDSLDARLQELFSRNANTDQPRSPTSL